MKNFLSSVGFIIAILLVLLLLFGVTFAGIAAMGIGLGRILLWVTPSFTVFEATLLATIFGFIAFALLRMLARLFLPAELMLDERQSTWDPGEEKPSGDYQSIPQDRFYKSKAERTWERWFTAEVANDLYAEFQDAPKTAGNLNQSQLQELSIRLAEAGVNIIKRKTGRARRLSTNLNDLRRELNRMGQRPYDDDILRLALSAINMNLNYFEEPLREVIHEQEWDRPTTMPESEA